MSTKILSVQERAQLYERMSRSVICIQSENRIIGGGVFVELNSKQLVLTAAHVVYEKENLVIQSFDRVSFDVRIENIERSRDIAFLDVIDKPEDGFQCARICKKSDLIRGIEIHYIGHPGRCAFSYNIGTISSSARTCHDIYRELRIVVQPDFPELRSNVQFIDDFRGLENSLRLVQTKNVHGGGRFGGTGAPFFDSDGHIVGLYSFTFKEEDYAIHVAEIHQSLRDLRSREAREDKKGKARNDDGDGSLQEMQKSEAGQQKRKKKHR